MSQITPELETKVVELIHQGRKLEAVKVVKDNTNLDLRESKEYVDAIELMPKKQSLIHFELHNESINLEKLTPNLEADVIKLIKANKMIHAVKLVLENTKLGLKASKDYVDALRANLK